MENGQGLVTGRARELFDQGGEAIEVWGELGGERSLVASFGLLLGEEEDVGEALEGIVDLVSEVVGHGGGGSCGGFFEQLCALF